MGMRQQTDEIFAAMNASLEDAQTLALVGQMATGQGAEEFNQQLHEARYQAVREAIRVISDELDSLRA